MATSKSRYDLGIPTMYCFVSLNKFRAVDLLVRLCSRGVAIVFGLSNIPHLSFPLVSLLAALFGSVLYLINCSTLNCPL